ncbi:MAG: SPOR domain-containing protein [Candidatus Omnitrophota bacterium]
MEKQDYSQLDLFNKAEEGESSAQRISGTFLSYIRTYERLVLMLIGLVITGVVCFCVGVEKGKRIALYQINSNLDIAYKNKAAPFEAGVGGVQARSSVNTQPVRATPAAIQPVNAAPVVVNQPVAVAKGDQPSKGLFTIQVATYTGKMSAQQELAVLKKQGLAPALRSSGKYIVLSVGNFPDQATAKSVLTQLKRKYRDCYIRRL